MTRSIQEIKTRLEKGLPGWQAQRLMSVREDEHLRTTVPQHAKKAAVLSLVSLHERPSVILIKRQAHEHDKHSGQLSFPGGQMEAGDDSLLTTALREAHEEIGLVREQIDVLGPLSPLYIPVSNFHVYPYLAISEGPHSWHPEPGEVAEVLELNLDIIIDQNVQYTDMHLRNGLKLSRVPFYPLENHKVWGATAMILAELGHILNSNSNFAIQ